MHIISSFYLSPNETLPVMHAAAEKAVELDDSLARAHTVLGIVLQHEWEWERAEAELSRGFELGPGDPYTLSPYGSFLCAMGRFDEAFPLLERALGVGPLDLAWRTNYALCLLNARKYDRAVEESLAILEVYPDHVNAHFLLALAYWNLGRDEESYQAFDWIHRQQGQDEEWLRGWERGYREAGLQGALRYLEGAASAGSPAVRALLNMTLGEVDTAFEWLERAYQARDPGLTSSLGAPQFDPIRADPRFQDLLRRIGFPEN